MSEVARAPVMAATDPTDPNHPQAAHAKVAAGSRLAQMISGQRIAMLSWARPDGSLDSKPMTLLELDADGALWFLCEHEPGDEATRERYRQVNLAFGDEVRSVFVSVTGRGELVHERERIRALWTQQARPFFPEGPESERLAALKVTPLRSECWESPGALLMQGAVLSVGG